MLSKIGFAAIGLIALSEAVDRPRWRQQQSYAPTTSYYSNYGSYYSPYGRNSRGRGRTLDTRRSTTGQQRSGRLEYDLRGNADLRTQLETDGIQLPNDLLLYAKTMTYVFSLGAELAPDVDLMKISLPYLLQFLGERD